MLLLFYLHSDISCDVLNQELEERRRQAQLDGMLRRLRASKRRPFEPLVRVRGLVGKWLDMPKLRQQPGVETA
jgi:hypothetical protein